MVPAMLLLVVAVFVIMGRWLRAKSDLEQLPRTAPMGGPRSSVHLL